MRDGDKAKGKDKSKVKEIWIKADEGTWDDKKSRITAGLESGIDAVLVEESDVSKVKELGRIKVAAIVSEEIPFEVGKEADIVVYGKRSEGDGTKPIPPCLLYTSPSPRDRTRSRMPSSA